MPIRLQIVALFIFLAGLASSSIAAPTIPRTELEAKAIFEDVIRREQQDSNNCMIRDAFLQLKIEPLISTQYLHSRHPREIDTPRNDNFAKVLPESIFKSFDGCAVHNELGFRNAILRSAKDQGLPAANYEVYNFTFPIFEKDYRQAIVVVLHESYKIEFVDGKWSNSTTVNDRHIFVYRKLWSAQWHYFGGEEF